MSLSQLKPGNKTPPTGRLKQQTFISHRPGGWTSRIKAPADLVPVRNSGLAGGRLLAVSSRGLSSVCAHGGQETEEKIGRAHV